MEYLSFEELKQAWEAIQLSLQDPQRVHAMAVHLPIVIAALGAVFVLILLLTGGKWTKLKWLTVFLFIAGAVLGWWASETGETALENFRHADLSEAAKANLDRHKFFGEWMWIGMLGSAFLVAIAMGQKIAWRVVALLLALVVAVANAGWVGLTAHYGGVNVYVHGVGVPETPDNITNLRKTVEPPPDNGTTDGKPDDDKPDGDGEDKLQKDFREIERDPVTGLPVDPDRPEGQQLFIKPDDKANEDQGKKDGGEQSDGQQ